MIVNYHNLYEDHRKSIDLCDMLIEHIDELMILNSLKLELNKLNIKTNL